MYYLTFDTPAGPVDCEISDWARWVAQDESGRWFQYELPPEISRALRIWTVHKYRECRAREICEGTPPADWTQEIYEVVR